MRCRVGLLCALILAGMVGCDNALPIYVRTEGGYGGARPGQKRSWTVRGALANPQAAVDGDLASIARTGKRYDRAELTIDMKEMILFQTVIIDHGLDQHGYCRRVGVATSVDGEIFIDRYEAPGTRRVTILSLPAPVLARYLRLRAVKPGARPWSVAEVFLQ